ncbi:MAG: radical SAM family heme chaperone HemW [Planctomycetota bacterium]|mgnify:FL=1
MAHNTALPIFGQRPPLSAHPLSGEGDRARGPVRSLYIHTPFCSHKCHYCDFYSIVDTRDRQAPFLDRLERELEALAPFASGLPLLTIFVGGGTPSLLRLELWQRLLATLGRLFDMSEMRGGDGGTGEFTVECNPETVTPELMATLKEGGVSRVSIGAQSFNPVHLKTLERWHDPANVARAVGLARSAGILRQSVDLIFAIPGQTPSDWADDLSRAVALGTEHISCYALTYEPNTAMTARLKRGEFSPAEEELEANLFEQTLATLRSAGLDRYEVSNFARPGAECRHNMAYWRQDQWLAAGPSASGHVAGHRWKNPPRLDDYLAVAGGLGPVVDHEPPDRERALVERMMTGLRLSEGFASAEVLAEADAIRPMAAGRLEGAARRMAEDGRLTLGDRWQLTDSGFLIADRLIVDFMDALEG